MSRTFKTVDYAQALDLTVRLGDCLPPDHVMKNSCTVGAAGVTFASFSPTSC
jgi:hypothetical protein